jgi:hypothetical protein
MNKRTPLFWAILMTTGSFAGDVSSNSIKHPTENPHTAHQIEALKQFERAMKSTITVNLSDISAVRVAGVKVSNAINCLYFRFDISNGDKSPAIIIREIESITINTKQKSAAYLAFNKALDGTATTIPEGDTCEKLY